MHYFEQERQGSPRIERDPPALYQLEHDPSEQYNIAADHPDVISRIQERVDRHLRERDAEIERLGTL
jgi:arylsulfatase A